MGPPQGRAEVEENLPRPAAHTPPNASQDPIGLLGSQGTLLAHGHPVVHQDTQVPLRDVPAVGARRADVPPRVAFSLCGHRRLPAPGARRSSRPPRAICSSGGSRALPPKFSRKHFHLAKNLLLICMRVKLRL